MTTQVALCINKQPNYTVTFDLQLDILTFDLQCGYTWHFWQRNILRHHLTNHILCFLVSANEINLQGSLLVRMCMPFLQ